MVSNSFLGFAGTFVRIAPNHVSIADPDAFKVIYAHVTGGLKDRFYDANVSTRANIFNTRDRVEHARKRKIVSHIFSLKNTLEYEPYIRLHAQGLVRQWDKLAEGGKKGLSGTEGEGWFGKDGRVWYDALPCESTPSELGSAKTDSSHLFFHQQGSLTSRSILSVISPSVPPLVCSTLRRMYFPWSNPGMVSVRRVMQNASLYSRSYANAATTSVHWAFYPSGSGPS